MAQEPETSFIENAQKRSLISAAAHYFMADRYEYITRFVQFCIILFASVITFFSFYWVDSNIYNDHVKLIVPTASIFIAALSSLQIIANWQNLAERHRFIARKYGSIKQQLDILNEKSKVGPKNYLEEVAAIIREMGAIEIDAPPLNTASIRHAQKTLSELGPRDRANIELNKQLHNISMGNK